jgi:hypothetical protein
MREIESQAAETEISRLIPVTAATTEAPFSVASLQDLKPVPPEFLTATEPRVIGCKIGGVTDSLLDFLHRLEKQKDRTRTKADIVDEAIKAYVRERLTALGYDLPLTSIRTKKPSDTSMAD